ncbi:MAG TPA: nuclear transport factor 2 family protein [Woeseiaceae bacterium]|nr:nuclear transport factor 2 family protein [Woeseiaceae bacterium]
MKENMMVRMLFTGICLLGLTSPALAQSDSDPADVWAVVEEVWNSDEKGDKKWPDKLLSNEFVGWGKSSPAPRGKESIKMWDRFDDQLGKTVAHELYPLSIVVRGDVAVAHYLYTAAFEDKDGEIETSNGRYTDVLVRTDTGWKFLAWHGGQDD